MRPALEFPGSSTTEDQPMADETNGKNGAIRISLSTIQFLIQLAVFLLAISAWGWSIKNEVALQAERQNTQKEKTEDLSRRVELLRYDVNQLQLALASKGIITIKEVP